MEGQSTIYNRQERTFHVQEQRLLTGVSIMLQCDTHPSSNRHQGHVRWEDYKWKCDDGGAFDNLGDAVESSADILIEACEALTAQAPLDPHRQIADWFKDSKAN